jgi:hypothetical protein
MRWLLSIAVGLFAATSLIQAQQPDTPVSRWGGGGLPISVELPTLNNHLQTLAGMTVHVRRASVHRIVAPQAFVVEDTQDFGFDWWHGPRYKALVVTDRAVPGLREEVPVTVTGRAVTYFDAVHMRGRPDLLMDEKVTDRYEDAVVLMADQVTTPAGIELYARQP